MKTYEAKIMGRVWILADQLPSQEEIKERVTKGNVSWVEFLPFGNPVEVPPPGKVEE